MATRPEGFEELYNDERSRLERSTIHIAGDRAQDIVHDAFVTYLTRGSNVTFPKAWLGRVARNRALNDLRRPREVSLEPDADGPRLVADDPAAEAETDAVRSLVADALGDLDERSRLALRLRFFEEKDYLEIASALGVRVAQAHVILHRSAKRLGRALVRRLADLHGALECVPALEELAGIGGKAEGHGRGACARCLPVLDELAALRSLGLLPVGIAGLWRRLAAEVAARAGRTGSNVPAVEPAGQWAAAILTIGITVASAVAPPPAPAIDDVPAGSGRPKQVVVQRERGVREERAQPRDDAVDASRTAREQGPDTIVGGGGPVTIRGDDDHTQGEVSEGDGAPTGGVIVCEPLEPCPPPPSPEP